MGLLKQGGLAYTSMLYKEEEESSPCTPRLMCVGRRRGGSFSEHDLWLCPDPPLALILTSHPSSSHPSPLSLNPSIIHNGNCVGRKLSIHWGTCFFGLGSLACLLLLWHGRQALERRGRKGRKAHKM